MSLGVLNTTAEASSLRPSEGLLFSLRLSPLELVTASECPEVMRSCCYDQDIDLEAFDVPCLTPSETKHLAGQEDQKEQEERAEPWFQLCEADEAIPSSQDQCGSREFSENNGDIR